MGLGSLSIVANGRPVPLGGGGVISLNGLAGNLTVAAGQGVTVGTSGSNITVNANVVSVAGRGGNVVLDVTDVGNAASNANVATVFNAANTAQSTADNAQTSAGTALTLAGNAFSAANLGISGATGSVLGGAIRLTKTGSPGSYNATLDVNTSNSPDFTAFPEVRGPNATTSTGFVPLGQINLAIANSQVSGRGMSFLTPTFNVTTNSSVTLNLTECGANATQLTSYMTGAGLLTMHLNTTSGPLAMRVDTVADNGAGNLTVSASNVYGYGNNTLIQGRGVFVPQSIVDGAKFSSDNPLVYDGLLVAQSGAVKALRPGTGNGTYSVAFTNGTVSIQSASGGGVVDGPRLVAPTLAVAQTDGGFDFTITPVGNDSAASGYTVIYSTSSTFSTYSSVSSGSTTGSVTGQTNGVLLYVMAYPKFQVSAGQFVHGVASNIATVTPNPLIPTINSNITTALSSRTSHDINFRANTGVAVNNGDAILIVLALGNTSVGTITPPAGFTLVSSLTQTGILLTYVKVSSGSESGTTFNFTFQFGTTSCAMAYIISNYNSIETYQTATVGTGFDESITIPQVTTLGASRLLLAFAFVDANINATGSFTSIPSGMTSLNAMAYDDPGVSSSYTIWAFASASVVQTSAGASGTKTFTTSAGFTNKSFMGILLAIKP